MSGKVTKPKKGYPLGALPLSEDERLKHLAAVGNVASEWAWFELWLDMKTLEMGDIPLETGICLTSQIAGAGRKLDAYIALATHLGTKVSPKEFQKYAKETTNLSERRNRVVHDPWLIEEGTPPTRLEATARKKLRFLVIPFSTEHTNNLADEIRDHLLRFNDIHRRVMEDVRT